MISSLLEFYHKDKNSNSHEAFIPAVCFYNESTLITKNSDLIQTIQIPSKDIENQDLLDQLIQNIIRKEPNDYNLSFWIHNISQPQEALQNQSTHKSLLDNIERELQSKNNNNFTNKVYISVIYRGRLKKFIPKDRCKNQV